MARRKKPRIGIITKILKATLDEYQWRHRNTIFIIISIIMSYVILTSSSIHDLVVELGELGYIGAFAAGIFFTFFFTAIPATIGIFLLGENLNPFLLAAVAALGSVLSDYIIYRFVKDSFVKEIEDFSPTLKNSIRNLKQASKKSRFIRNLIPLIAGFIIASPLPDELAAGLLGVARLHPKRFLMYAYFFNFLGIFVIASLAKIL